MNVQLSPAQLKEITTLTLSKRDKLLRLATLVRQDPFRYIAVFSSLEFLPVRERDWLQHPDSAFALAASDPVLQDAGLHGATIGDAVRFFELSQNELHEFSCDCGGHISNEMMARRIEHIAARAA